MNNARHCFFAACTALIVLAGCRNDEPPVQPTQPPVVGNNGGVYVINEGNFQFGNAKVGYYDIASGNATEDLFQPANGVALGDVCQSMRIFNGKAYIVVNNSGKIVVVNPQTFVATATITGFPSPRYFLPVSNGKAYVTDLYANRIAIVNLSTNTISGTIACPGWTEELVLAYGKAFVTNQSRNKVYVINTSTDALEDSITVSNSSSSICEDKNGKLWVLCNGSASNSIYPALHRINPLTLQVEQSFAFPAFADNPWRLCMNGSNDTLYFLNNDVYRMGIDDAALPNSAFIPAAGRNLYGLGIDPVGSIVYVADAVDYVQRGVVYRYRADGTQLNTFMAGIIPAGFYFN